MLGDPLALSGVIQIARARAFITADAGRVSEARSQFESCGALVLRGFLEPSLLDWVRSKVRVGVFTTKVHPASGQESCMQHNEAVWTLEFLLEAHDVLRAVEAVTGQGPLTGLKPRVYRFEPTADHFHDWHDDVGDDRRLGLSVNLSEETFEGGNLQVRERSTESVLADVRNTGPGDAVIFRIGGDLQHQVLPVTGSHPRVVLAGWFRGPAASLTVR